MALTAEKIASILKVKCIMSKKRKQADRKYLWSGEIWFLNVAREWKIVQDQAARRLGQGSGFLLYFFSTLCFRLPLVS